MQQCGVWRPKHRPCGFICGQRASDVDALCAMHCAMLHHHFGGKLGGCGVRRARTTTGTGVLCARFMFPRAVTRSSGYGQHTWPRPGGETGRRCMVISRGASTRGLTGVQCGKRRGPQCGVCAPATTKSRGGFPAVRSLGNCLLLYLQSAWP